MPGSSDGARFLSALFCPGDIVLIRPLESWLDENGQAKTRVVFDAIQHLRIGIRRPDGGWSESPRQLEQVIEKLNRTAERERANVYFGVCPRFGGKGEYDKAWQIRTVRCLWADLDGTTPEKSVVACESAGLPEPSIVVRSGNGAHLYWLLDQPVILDDYDGDPLPIRREYSDEPDPKTGRKRSQQFMVEPNGNKIYLAHHERIPLSEKAQHIQDIMLGIMAKTGGDHTFDISRILRVPGTFNRKDERNGRKPKPCELFQFDESRRYNIEQFNVFADFSNEKKKRNALQNIALPVQKKITSKKSRDKLSELINASLVADEGERSDRDYHLCCVAVENGWLKSDVWAAVANVGKFGERGHEYFERTWAKAEQNTRSAIYDSQIIRKSTKEQQSLEIQKKSALYQSALERIQLEVLGRYSGGMIKVLSKSSRSVETIRNIDQYGYSMMLGLAGPLFRENVVRVADEDSPIGSLDLKTVQEAIAEMSHGKQWPDGSELGIGCWLSNGDKEKSVAVVGSRCVFEWNGREIIERNHPILGDLVFDFEKKYRQWYDLEKVRRNVELCRDPQYRESVLDRLLKILNRWNWQYQSMPKTVAGVIFATWIQTLWSWRPQILVGGETNSGKSTLFRVLGGLFGHLSCKSSQSSAAGLRQALSTTARIPLCDEFDAHNKSQERMQGEILKMVRSAGRGDSTLRGTAHQQEVEFSLRHIFWMAGTNVEFEDATDKNRFIIFELEPAATGKENQLVEPSAEELRELGDEIFAVSLYCSLNAIDLAARLTKSIKKIDKAHSRQIESYSVPAAMIAAILGESDQVAAEILRSMMEAVSHDKGLQVINEHESLMDDILMAQIPHRESGKRPVSVWINEVLVNNSTEAAKILEDHGIKISSMEAKDAENIKDSEPGDKCLIIHPKMIQRTVLAGTQWESSGFKHAIKGFGEWAFSSRRRMAGRVVDSRVISLDYLQREFLEDFREPDSPNGKF